GVEFGVFGFVLINHQQILHLKTPLDRLDRRHPVEPAIRETTSSGKLFFRREGNCGAGYRDCPPASASRRRSSLISSNRFVTSRMTATVPATSCRSSCNNMMVNSTEMRRPPLVSAGTDSKS